jgi:hypothetical protein
MNLLIYYASICVSIFMGLPLIGTFTKDPITQKLVFLGTMFVVNFVFYIINNATSKKVNRKKMVELFDKSMLGSFILLFGLLLYYDLDDSEMVMKLLPQIKNIYGKKWFMLVSIVSPSVVLNLLKLLFVSV